MLLLELDELLAVLLCRLLVVLLGVFSQEVSVLESFRRSSNWRWLDWHRHCLTGLKYSPIAECSHTADSAFFPVAELCFDVIFYFIKPPLQVSDSLIVRHVRQIVCRLRLLRVKIESICKSLISRGLIKLHVGLGCYFVELRILPLNMSHNLNIALRILVLITT